MTAGEDKRILLVTYYYPPMGGAGSLRMWHLSRGLAEQGWEVTVLTVKEVDHAYRDPALLDDLPENLRIVRAESRDPVRVLRRLRGERPPKPTGDAASGGSPIMDLARRVGKLVSFPDTRRGWIGPAVAEGVRLVRERSPALLLSSSPPASAHLAGMRIRERTGVPWVADFRDPMSLFLYPSLYPTGFHRRRIAALEEKILEGADGIIANTPGMGEYFQDRVPSAGEKMAVIPNGYDPALFARESSAGGDVGAGEKDTGGETDGGPTGPEGTGLREGNRIVLLHTGSLGAERHLGTFLESLEGALKDRPDLSGRFRLRYLGEVRPGVWKQLQHFAAKHGEEMVEVLPAVPSADAAGEMMRAAALLLVHHPGPGPEISVPCKLYEYLGAGRPVLAICPPGDARNLLRGHPAAFVADFDDVDGIRREILRLGDYLESGEESGAPGMESAREHAWGKRVKALDGFLSGILEA